MVLGKPIAVGRTAEVFAWDDHHVVKLFRPEITHSKYEFSVCTAVYNAGIPSPRPLEYITVGDRQGIVLERVQGRSMLDELTKRPYKIFILAKQMGLLHAHFHTHQIAGDTDFLPTAHEILATKIDTADVSKGVKDRAHERLEVLPRADTICHGDFHPGNIMLDEHRQVIIDWRNVFRGHPLADVVQTRLLLSLDNLTPDQPNRVLINMLRSTLLKGYWKGYGQGNPILKDWQHWVLPAAVARLSDEIETERAGLLSMIASCTRTSF
jgi:uncharacterized protein (TIGR02172 family)